MTSKLNIFPKVNLSISPRRAVSDTVYLQSHDRTHQSGPAFAYSSTYVSERAMCARSYLRMWVRHTREASWNRSAGRKLCIRNRTRRFNGERKRRLKKRETARARWLVWESRGQAGDSASLWYLKIHFWLVPQTMDNHRRRPPPSFFPTFSHSSLFLPCVSPLFNRRSHLTRKPDDTLVKRRPRSETFVAFPAGSFFCHWDFRTVREKCILTELQFRTVFPDWLGGDCWF